MSIIGALKDAIFGSKPQRPQQPTGTAAQASAAASAPGRATAPTPASASTQSSAPAATSSGAQVDIEQVLSAKAAQKHEKLNWQSSIVDLMKLVDLDPSLDNRKTLAHELGYRGDTQDSASLNVWLHQQVMHELEAAGGKVPNALRH